jgi:hypothetical protein
MGTSLHAFSLSVRRGHPRPTGGGESRPAHQPKQAESPLDAAPAWATRERGVPKHALSQCATTGPALTPILETDRLKLREHVRMISAISP